MLIATQKAAEYMVCNVGETTVRVWVFGISENRVMLGIQGPEDIAVQRIDALTRLDSSEVPISPAPRQNNKENVPTSSESQ